AFIYGHTAMQRALGLGYQSEWAKAHFPTRKMRNEFYTQVGEHLPPGQETLSNLKAIIHTTEPDVILSHIIR
ncbi:MAG: hypothetical protein ACK2UQ_05280, partial [Anaerolineae bacterium]